MKPIPRKHRVIFLAILLFFLTLSSPLSAQDTIEEVITIDAQKAEPVPPKPVPTPKQPVKKKDRRRLLLDRAKSDSAHDLKKGK